MAEIKIVTNSFEETSNLAFKLASVLERGNILLLNGNLGAGKTTFVKGLARGLNIKEVVKSPTFNIVKCYFSGNIPLFHIDAYRLEDQKYDIGLDEYIEGNGICAIEWSIFIEYLLPNDCITINIEGEGESPREISILGNDDFINKVRGVL